MESNQATIVTDWDKFKLNVNLVNKSNNEDPDFATVGSAGFDFRASLTEDIVLGVGKSTVIKTGLFFELPPNIEIQVRPRSGLAAKFGITVLNSPGTIDSDYTGEVGVILINLGETDFKISNGDRIAQGVIGSVFGKSTLKFTKVDSIEENADRGSAGFGSTGKQ